MQKDWRLGTLFTGIFIATNLSASALAQNQNDVPSPDAKPKSLSASPTANDSKNAHTAPDDAGPSSQPDVKQSQHAGSNDAPTWNQIVTNSRVAAINHDAVELVRTGQLEAAAAKLEQALTINQKDVNTRLNLGVIYSHLASAEFSKIQLARADLYFRKSITLLESAPNSNLETVLSNYSDMLHQLNRTKEAEPIDNKLKALGH
jgi:tetratricopeptide (TPR) repeat protein